MGQRTWTYSFLGPPLSSGGELILGSSGGRDIVVPSGLAVSWACQTFRGVSVFSISKDFRWDVAVVGRAIFLAKVQFLCRYLKLDLWPCVAMQGPRLRLALDVTDPSIRNQFMKVTHEYHEARCGKQCPRHITVDGNCKVSAFSCVDVASRRAPFSGICEVAVPSVPLSERCIQSPVLNGRCAFHAANPCAFAPQGRPKHTGPARKEACEVDKDTPERGRKKGFWWGCLHGWSLCGLHVGWRDVGFAESLTAVLELCEEIKGVVGGLDSFGYDDGCHGRESADLRGILRDTSIWIPEYHLRYHPQACRTRFSPFFCEPLRRDGVLRFNGRAETAFKEWNKQKGRVWQGGYFQVATACSI